MDRTRAAAVDPFNGCSNDLRVIRFSILSTGFVPGERNGNISRFLHEDRIIVHCALVMTRAQPSSRCRGLLVFRAIPLHPTEVILNDK